MLMSDGPRRFNELLAAIPDLSDSTIDGASARVD
jgi:DNA-binding HxlR family transcriptional regulator